MSKLGRSIMMVAAVVAQASVAHAATEVIRLPANNTFVDAVWTDPDTGVTTGVFVSRTLGAPGGPVDTLFFIQSTPDEVIASASAVLPHGAFHVSAQAASLDVDVNTLTLENVVGEIPDNGVISIDWTATDIQRTSGSTKFDLGNGKALIVGTRADATADPSGTVFGEAVPDDALANISVVRSAVIIIQRS